MRLGFLVWKGTAFSMQRHCRENFSECATCAAIVRRIRTRGRLHKSPALLRGACCSPGTALPPFLHPSLSLSLSLDPANPLAIDVDPHVAILDVTTFV